MSPSAVLLGQLLSIAFACGLNLYATVALLGLASRLGWMAGLPPGLRGLENSIVIGSAALLYLFEFVIDKVPYIDSVWNALHTFIRPTSAALLAFFALEGAPGEIRIAGAMLAGGAALASHGAKAGLRLLLRGARKWSRTVLSVIEDLLAIGLAMAALTHPTAAVGVVAATLLLMLAFGPLLWRASVLGIRAAAALLRGFFGTRGWREGKAVPTALRGLLDAPELGAAAPRAARAAVRGIPAAGGYRNGWLVVDGRRRMFLYRALFRPRRADFPADLRGRSRPGLLTEVVELESADAAFTLFLLKDGPSADHMLAELGAESMP